MVKEREKRGKVRNMYLGGRGRHKRMEMEG